MRQQFHMSTATTSFSKSKSVMDVSANLGHRIWFWQRPLILKRADIHGKNQPWQASMDLRKRACRLRSTACLRTVAQAAHESHMDTRKLDVSPHYSSTCRACGMAEAIGDVDL